MATRRNTRLKGVPSFAALCAGVTVLFAATHAAGQSGRATDTTVGRLIGEAQQAALSGNAAQCYALLRDAVRVAPDDGLARWQLGQIQVDGEWLAVEEAQRRAAADPKQAEYRRLRDQYGESAAGQLALARWCRKNKLEDEAKFHWASVLSVQPQNEEARRALEVRWENGRLVTHAEALEAKERLRAWNRAAKKWAPRIAQWQRALGGSDAAARDAALEEIRSLTAVEAIPALEEITLGRDAVGNRRGAKWRDLSLAFIAALDAMPEHAATESLVRHAVFSPAAQVRAQAIESLKKRPQHDFVPTLLSGLATPVESSFSVATDGDGSVHYWHSLYRQGADTDWSRDVRLSAMQHNLGGRRYTWDVAKRKLEIGPPVETEATIASRKAAVATRYQNRYGRQAAAIEWQVLQANQLTQAYNERIVPVLVGTTGQDFGNNAKAWWDWWQEQNEYYASDDRPVDRQYHSDTDSYYYGGYNAYDVRYPPPPPPPKRSCFAKGTLVWTKTGERPIETLELGDLVLAQNVDTGELAYKPVIGRTVRPPSPILKLSLGDEELLTTRGHPFWVAGVGWRMAKELGDAAMLYGVTGAARVEAIESAGEAEAYNLVVADFNTYFVGESGVLVHDNTPRLPTLATVPGLVAK